MSNSDEHLIRMANDIAANLSPGKSEQKAVEAIAGHIKKFWAPPMRKNIITLMQKKKTSLSDNAQRAIVLLSL